MTEVEKNRLAHTRALIRLLNTQTEFADRIGVRNSYINQIAGPNPSRAIGDRTANKIEKVFGLEPGALDRPPEVRSNDGTVSEIVSTLANAGSLEKELVLSFSHWIVARAMELSGKKSNESKTYDVGSIVGETKSKQNKPAGKKDNLLTGATRNAGATKGGTKK